MVTVSVTCEDPNYQGSTILEFFMCKRKEVLTINKETERYIKIVQ